MLNRIAFALLFLLSATQLAHADICSTKINLSFAPNTPLRSATNGWFQWLNAGTASCSGSSTHLSCNRGGAIYTFDYSCDSQHCYVEAFDSHGWRNEAVMPTGGTVWGWTWDGWKNGYLQASCQVVDPATVVCNYTTCD